MEAYSLSPATSCVSSQPQPNLWTPVITDAFFNRLCAAGTLHRQVNNTHQKKVSFLASRIGLTETQFNEMNPLDYEASYMWGWTVVLTPEERSTMASYRSK